MKRSSNEKNMDFVGQEQKFLRSFRKNWYKLIEVLPSASIVLKARLVYWGFTLGNAVPIENDVCSEIGELAVYSVFIQEISTTFGKVAYEKNLMCLNKSLCVLQKGRLCRINNQWKQNDYLENLISVTCDALEHLEKPILLRKDFNKIKNLFYFESKKALEGFLFGFLISDNKNIVINSIDKINTRLAYVVKIKEEVETFPRVEKDSLTLNLLKSLVQKKENKILDMNFGEEVMISLFETYNIYGVFFEELKYIKTEINSDISNLSQAIINKQWLIDFRNFVEYLTI